MTDQPEMRSGAEFDLIRAVRDRLVTSDTERYLLGIGDDAAVTIPGGVTATSVDALVEGVHFRSAWCAPREAGHKAMAAALSDLAAMGAEAGEAYTWLGVPPSFSEPECLEVCDGLASVAERHRVAMLGGDVTRCPVLALAVTAVGHAADPARLVGRAGAAVGDAVCMTGAIGAAVAGLALLEREGLSGRLDRSDVAALTAAQLRPEPRLEAGRALAGSGASALIDISDGLGADAENLAAAGGVGIEIELSRVPLAAGVAELAAAAGRDPIELALGGEDYELLCALPRPRLAAARRAVSRCGADLTEIGRVVAGAGVRLRLPDGRALSPGGYDQLAR